MTIWPVSSRRPPTGFYVYRLLGPRTGLVFYVGKGQRFRAWHHQLAVAAGRVHANAAVEAAITDLIGRLEQADGARFGSTIGEMKAAASALAATIPANTPAASTSENLAPAEADQQTGDQAAQQ